MYHVICCWCDGDPDNFEKHVPVLFSGQRNLRLGFSNKIDLLFLSGYELLSQEYKSRLRDTGYTVHDLTTLYQKIESKYYGLRRFGNYETKCFLRWLVVSSYFPGEPIIHYDGDIVFNEDSATIGKLLKGRTFVLQGCPALTAISDHTWFSQYREELAIFVNDIEGYSAKAWTDRVGWEISQRGKWAGSRDREIISSDQDFLSHLIHTDRIAQDSPSQILMDLSTYVVFENPLYMHGYENNLRGVIYRRNMDIDYIDERRVLFWHMQSYFVQYLNKFIFRKKYLRRGSNIRMTNDLVEKKDLNSYLYNLFTRYFYMATRYRLNVYEYFFEENDFSEVFNDKSWWQEGVFA